MNKFLCTLSVLTLTAVFLSLHSCKKDKDKSPDNPLATVWAPQQYEITEHYDGSDHKQNMTAGDNDYLSLKADGTCNGRLYLLGKFTGRWILQGKTLKIEQANVEHAYMLDHATSFTFDLNQVDDKVMQVRLRLKLTRGIAGVNKIKVLSASASADKRLTSAADLSSDYMDLATELINLYNESVGKGYISFDNQAFFIKRTEAANVDMFGNIGFYIYGYGVGINGEPMQMFVRWSSQEVHAPQNLIFGSRGLTLLHVQWYYPDGTTIDNSRERTFGADGEQIRVSANNGFAFALSFANLTEMDKWNDRPRGNGVKATGYLRGNPTPR